MFLQSISSYFRIFASVVGGLNFCICIFLENLSKTFKNSKVFDEPTLHILSVLLLMIGFIKIGLGNNFTDIFPGKLL